MNEKGGRASRLRAALDRYPVGPILAGLLAGYSVTLLGAGAVSLPLVGPVPGTALGGVGLVASVAVYRRVGCDDGCGCSGACGDRCSYDP